MKMSHYFSWTCRAHKIKSPVGFLDCTACDEEGGEGGSVAQGDLFFSLSFFPNRQLKSSSSQKREGRKEVLTTICNGDDGEKEILS